MHLILLMLVPCGFRWLRHQVEAQQEEGEGGAQVRVGEAALPQALEQRHPHRAGDGDGGERADVGVLERREVEGERDEGAADAGDEHQRDLALAHGPEVADDLQDVRRTDQEKAN